jgi:hypothetical protein
VGELLY